MHVGAATQTDARASRHSVDEPSRDVAHGSIAEVPRQHLQGIGRVDRIGVREHEDVAGGVCRGHVEGRGLASARLLAQQCHAS